MPRSLRPFVLLALALASAYGLVSACSLDLDESLISGSGGDASLGDAQSLGGFEGGAWSDAKADGASNDGNGGSEAATEAGTDASDGGFVDEGISCGPTSCDPGAYCCWEANSGLCAADPAECTSVAIACDAASDCGAGELCCMLNIGGTVGCATTCPDTPIGKLQFCGDATECTTGVCDAPTSLFANLLPPGYKACE